MIEIRISEDHVWARVEEDGTVLVGVTDFGQSKVGEITHIEMPEIGHGVNVGDELGSLESEDGGFEIYAPLTGNVVEVNELLEDEPSLVNDSPLDDGWLFRMEVDDVDLDALDDLMDEGAYEEFLSDLE